MRIILRVAALAALLAFVRLSAQTAGQVVVSSSHTTDATGAPVASATLTITPAANTGLPISFRSPSGNVIVRPVQVNVVNGAWSVDLYDSALTTPANVCYSLSMTDNVTGRSLLGPGYACLQPSGYPAQVSGSSSWCTAAVNNVSSCNFDNFAPNLAGIAVVQSGPPGPFGTLNWRGPWNPNTAYAKNDAYIEAGTGYVVYQAYSSGSSFGSLDTASATPIGLVTPGSNGEVLYNANGITAGAPLQVANGQSNAASAQASATCYTNLNGTLSVIPQTYGAGYSSSPTVTLSNVPSGSSATVVANAPVNGQITSYTVSSSSGWYGQMAAYGHAACPATITVSAPPAASAPTPVINPANVMTTLSPVIRVDDFGAVGNGTTDDTAAIQKAMNYAATFTGVQNPVVAFTAGKTYYLGSVSGTYSGAGDDGTVPVAATLNCTATSGVVSGCTIGTGGYWMQNGVDGYITLASGTSGSGASFSPTFSACTTAECPTAVGSYLSSISASGGTGYPSTFTVYVGPTCKGIPCTVLVPEPPTQIGYSVQIPTAVIVEGNGAEILGGFLGSYVGASSYNNSWPYVAAFAMGTHIIVRDLNLAGTFIGFGNYQSYDQLINVSAGSAVIAQGENVQMSKIDTININQQNSSEAGFFFGGQWATRAPKTGTNGGTIANTFDLVDGTIFNFVDLYLSMEYSLRKPLDCWFDVNFFHIEDQGITNSDNCYTPPGGVVRMPDQDVAAQDEPDDLWRGIFGVGVGAYNRYGRPINGLSINGLDLKLGLSYGVVIGPIASGTTIENISSEGQGNCNSNASYYGSSACPNPYEPQYPQLQGLIETDAQVELTNAVTNWPILGVLSKPWQKMNFSNLQAASQGNLPAVLTTDLSSVAQMGSVNWVAALASPVNNYANQRTSSGALNSDSQSVIFSGSNDYASPGRSDFWDIRVADSLVPWGGNYNAAPESVLEFRSRTTNAVYQSSAVKVPALYVDNFPTANGSVSNLTITNGGSGYTPWAYVPCSMSQSTSTLYMPATSTPYTATCEAEANGSGVVSGIILTQPALGYTAAPTVTLGPPNSGGVQATATATLLQGSVPPDAQGLEDYLPLNKMYAYTFYLPSAVTVPAYSQSAITGYFCPGGDVNDHATLLSLGSTLPVGTVSTVSTTNGSTCTITLQNFTSSSVTYPSGAGSPYQILLENSLLGGSDTPGWIQTITPSSTTTTALVPPSSDATCTMSASTTCTATVSTAATKCSATVQGSTPLYAAVAYSSGTVTVTASASNSDAWNVLCMQ